MKHPDADATTAPATLPAPPDYVLLIDETRPTLPAPTIVAQPLSSCPIDRSVSLKPPPIPRECRDRRKNGRRRDSVVGTVSTLLLEWEDLKAQLEGPVAGFRRDCLWKDLKRVEERIAREEQRSEAK